MTMKILNMNRLQALVVLATLFLFSTQPSFGQEQSPSSQELEALRQEIEALKQRQTAIQKELQEIKTLLRARGTAVRPRNVSLNIDGEPSLGDKDAPLTLIEFSEYQCPYCARHARETWPQLEKEYIATGKVKYVFRDFPLEQIHKNAFKAAEAAHCAGDQEKFWEMHDQLFANSKALGAENLLDYAQSLELDVPEFQQCLESGKYATEIRKDMAEGRSAGIRGTPMFFLGRTDPNGSEVRVLSVIRGARSYSSFKEAIDNLLSSPE